MKVEHVKLPVAIVPAAKKTGEKGAEEGSFSGVLSQVLGNIEKIDLGIVQASCPEEVPAEESRVQVQPGQTLSQLVFSLAALLPLSSGGENTVVAETDVSKTILGRGVESIGSPSTGNSQLPGLPVPSSAQGGIAESTPTLDHGMESGIKNAVPQLTGNSPTPAIPVLIATESKLDVSTPTPGRGVESGVENIRPRANDPQKLSVSPRAEGGAIVPNPAITEPNYPAITSTPIIPTNSVRTPAEAASVGESGGLETLVRAGRGDEIAPVNTETTSPTINTLVESVKPSGIAKMTVAIRAPVTAHEQSRPTLPSLRLAQAISDRQVLAGVTVAKPDSFTPPGVADTAVARGAEAESEPARPTGVPAESFPRTPVVTPSVSPTFIRELNTEIIAFAVRPTRSELTLEVSPREYGRVIVSAEMEQGVAIIRLVTETVAAKVALLEHLPKPTATLEVRVYTADEYREWAEDPRHGRTKEDGQEHRPPRKKEPYVEFKV